MSTIWFFGVLRLACHAVIYSVLFAITNFRTCDNDKTIRKVCDNDKL